MARITQQLVEINDRVVGPAGPNPMIDGLAFRLQIGRPEAGNGYPSTGFNVPP